MKRIGLDIQVLQYKEASGFGFYVAGLYGALQQQRPPEVEMIGLKSQWPENLPTWKRWYHDRFELPRAAREQAIDVLHQTCFSCPPYGKKVVWTLHDLRPLVLRERMSLPASLYWRTWLPRSQRYADRIVCTSESTRRDAAKYLGIAASEMEVIPVGVAESTVSWQSNPHHLAEYKKKFAITAPYFSTVATIQPIKNLPFLIDVFVALKKEFNLVHQLVIIGKKSWDYDTVKKKLIDHHLTEGQEVIITDYVSEDEKLSLIHGSVALLFPSLYEGFGIPPIEAQAVGTPVIASHASSLPDVIGDGGLLCSPTEVSDWIAAYDTLQRQRSDLIEKGKLNVKRFDWDTIAEQWLAVYKNV